EETDCCLYVTSSISTQEKVTRATVTVFPIGDGLIHGKKLLKGHMKVSIIKVVDFHKIMELLVLDDEFPALLNALSLCALQICPKHGRGFILDSSNESVFHTDDNHMLAGLVDL
nr:protein exportin 1A [Tanacetum cinerariifolium]